MRLAAHERKSLPPPPATRQIFIVTGRYLSSHTVNAQLCSDLDRVSDCKAVFIFPLPSWSESDSPEKLPSRKTLKEFYLFILIGLNLINPRR